MPVLALEIDGDTWRLHVAVAKESPETPEGMQEYAFELAFIGPLELGSTKDGGNLVRLFANLYYVVE